MFGIAKTLMKPRVAGVVAVLVLAWQGWVWMNPPAPALDSRRASMADEAAGMVADLVACLDGRGSIGVLPIAGDDTGYVAEAISDAIRAGGEFSQPDASLLDRVRSELNISPTAPESVVDALATGRRMQCAYVLVLRLETFSATKDRGHLILSGSVLQTEDGEEALPVRVEIVEGALMTGSVGRAILLFGVFLVCMVLLPLVTLPIIRRILAVESNLVTLAGLLSYTLVVGLLAMCLSTGWLLPTLALVAGLTYNYIIFTRLENRRGG